VCVCVCILVVATCHAKSMHCHLDCLAAPHYHVIGTIFDKNVFNIKSVFLLFLELSSETFVLLRRIQRNIVTNVYSSSCDALYMYSTVHVILARF